MAGLTPSAALTHNLQLPSDDCVIDEPLVKEVLGAQEAPVVHRPVYEVRLDAFEGPLDLLLHLIREHEIDIYDIPIATITQQYLDYINFMESLDLALAGEFLEMAATLIRIKVQMLLPKEIDGTEEEEDPREQLVRKLVEYRQFKEVATTLSGKEEERRKFFPRGVDPKSYVDVEEEIDIEDFLRDVTLFDLVDGLREVSEAATRFCPFLERYRPIATYAGLRCNCQQGSYQVVLNDAHPGIVTVAGVRSTGLTSSPALADHLIEQMVERCDLRLSDDPAAVDERPADRWPGWWRRPYDSADLVAQEPDRGRMVCFCEQISQQEIIDALSSPLCPPTLDAVKRRTRAMTGRCQAFNCGIPIAEVIAKHCDLPIESVTKRGPGTSLGGTSACCDAASHHVKQDFP